jgi:hypothetical protein
MAAQVHGKQRRLMIVSHKYRFIFLRTEKTASTSLMKALQSVVDENDLWSGMPRPAWAKFSPIHYSALRRYAPQWFGLHTHASASQVRRVIGPKIFDSYYKFAVERNPWDRQISLYAHRKWKRGKSVDDFDRDMQSLIYRNTSYVRMNNWSNYAIGREIVADRIIRYERLEDDIGELFAMLGIPGPIELPRLRKYTADRPHYSTYYGASSRDLVARWYAREIDALDYKFENQPSVAQPPSTPALVDRGAKVIRQGGIGGQGMFATGQAIAYGTQMAGGIPPKRTLVVSA